MSNLKQTKITLQEMQDILFNKVQSQNISPRKESSLKNSVSSARF
jgi:hypothetical protein